ncbi:ankyrin repeat protein, putative [Trichomonas vaginalis G3]|uniref:Ankyrin repeat protein, putative n=1 Tax=Trichomonas vaginalis (strain ATCC PRA-98 / G3) TaxID=412133 RepID=A2G647_TRIV3|nr:spectrin binding [Trichomonas vaginalis G3]EAX87363.1 ankyrin repeat protein, putative [Trichomonas vaginalis G3]KAI5537405.1 spectrin binding [Trichomonas vaginalis G3]|eukprot:XP_001300293.1 ankyrin repeat protein [Trichomonas vaginalis G3]
MNNDLEVFISFTKIEGFDKYQKFKSSLYPYSYYGYYLLELCCYYGAVDCFKFLRTKFNSKIAKRCLTFSFLGRNHEIMSECLKQQEPDKECMEYAIISHNIDFVTFLVNEYIMSIDLHACKKYNNLDSFLVFYDQTNLLFSCLIFSTMLNIPSLCEYFLSLGVDINKKLLDGDEKGEYGETALHIAAEYNSKEAAELLISYGANIHEKDVYGQTALHIAARENSKETAEVLISHGANINEKSEYGETSLHIAARENSKETAEVLILHGANINEKGEYGITSLHIAAECNNKEAAALLILHGANINEKDNYGQTALHHAARENRKETAEVLISHGININEKDKDGEIALHKTALNHSEKTAELLISHGAKN